MIQSLDDARKWYDAVKTLANDMRRLAEKWDDPALADFLGRDNRFRDRTSADLREMSRMVLDDLDPLAVLVLFTVFEATVRTQAKAEVERATERIEHPAVKTAVEELKEGIENGSFGKVTNAYKPMDPDLTEEVNQVRRVRNWVAHGRRGSPRSNVDPRAAWDRLDRYLKRLVEHGAAGLLEQPPAPPAPEPPPGG